MKFPLRRPCSSRTVLRSLGRRCRPYLQHGAEDCDADRYVKQYHSAGFAMAFVCHMLLRLSSVRELQARLDNDRQVQHVVGWDGISVSQLIKLQHKRSPQLWEPLIGALLKGLPTREMPSGLRVMDSSFFTMGLKLLGRRYGKRMSVHTAGFKLSLMLDPEFAAPVRWAASVGQGNDAAHLGDLVPDDEDIEGLTFLFDRGYRKYSFFDDLMRRKAHFVTRAAALIRYEIIAKRALDPAHPEIIADWLVRLGSRNGHNLMQRPVRMIQLQTETETLVFLASPSDLTAWETTELYRRRWEIEVFFRWLKRAVGCVRATGYSLTAAQHCFYAALVVYLIAVLMAQTHIDRKTGRTRLLVKSALHRLRAKLYQTPADEDLQPLEFL